MLNNEPTLRPGTFELPEDPLVDDVLIPGFRHAASVLGAFGWFTAGWIHRLAPGLAVFLGRTDVEPMRFTVAPTLFPNEKAAVEKGVSMSSDEAAALVAKVFIDGRNHANPLGLHALDCLAWMIAEDRLQLRVAVPTPDSNYHPKMWLFDDHRHKVLVRGSGNATGLGVGGGVEHMDVDVSWEKGSAGRVDKGLRMLQNWSSGASSGIKEVFDLPEALAKDIIRTAPSQPPQHTEYLAATGGGHAQPKKASPRPKLRIPEELEWETGPYAHQGEAVKAWEEGDPPERGVLEMATGAGKTLTALICATRCQDRLGVQPLLIVISAPSVPLILQWRKEVAKFGVKAVAPNLESNAASDVTKLFRLLPSGGTWVLIVTNNRLTSEDFQHTVASNIRRIDKPPIATLFVADEAHTLGADSFVHRPPEFFQKRLGLSATPERQYDPDGTNVIFAYFGPTVYTFGLSRAIGFCLAPYKYFVHACTLQEGELEDYKDLSLRITHSMNSNKDDAEENTKRLLIMRRRILETPTGKLGLLRDVLVHRGPRDLSHALIYASAKNPKQFEQFGNLLNELDIIWSPVTEKETSDKNKLQSILDSFEQGRIQVVLAKKVLDEGIDIPNIREAFIVASSNVEREWVQRRGRVLRKHPDKPWAAIHDFLALPTAAAVREESGKSISKIVQNELGRAYQFATHAKNMAGTDGVAETLKSLFDAVDSKSPSFPVVLTKPGYQFIFSATPRGSLW